MHTVDNYPETFQTQHDAESYAKTASEIFGLSKIIVRFDGFPVAVYYQGKKIGDGFNLDRQPATLPARAKFTSTPATQRVLLAGLDCAPGQADLFSTDGTN